MQGCLNALQQSFVKDAADGLRYTEVVWLFAIFLY